MIYAAACRLILLIGSQQKTRVKVQPTGDKKVMETSKPKKF